MNTRIAIAVTLLGIAVPAVAQEVTWRKDVQPIMSKQCGECHGPTDPEFAEWMVLREKNKKLAPRMDTYGYFMGFVAWPATGAVMRRLDDGKNASDGKPGNMYRHLGDTDAERAKNLAVIKAWIGEGGWNLSRWEARGSVPGVSKEQIDRIKAAY